MKDPLGVSPSKGNQGTTRGKEKFLLTSVGIEPTTSGLDLPLRVFHGSLKNKSSYQNSMATPNFGCSNTLQAYKNVLIYALFFKSASQC